MATETTPFAETPNRIPWAPLIYGIALIAGWPLQLAIPLPWFDGMASDMLFGFGAIGIICALLIDFSAMRTLHRKRTTIMPHRRADHLVTTGVYGWSRNPIYLANTMLVLGVGLLSGVAWYILLAFLAAFATQQMAIRREEKHLEHRFGKAFRDYRKKVSRWF